MTANLYTYKITVPLMLFVLLVSAQMPQWVGDPVPIMVEGAPLISTHKGKDCNVTVALGDWDNDGDLDLFLSEDQYQAKYPFTKIDENGEIENVTKGGTEPRVFLYKNSGDKNSYQFEKRVRIEGLSKSAFVPTKSG